MPKMNAHAERFNRTAQEEFLDYLEDLLWGDEANLAALNRKLAEWLLWFNGERPHEALGQQTPIVALARERSMLVHLPRPSPPRAAEPATPPPHRPTGRVPSSMRNANPLGLYTHLTLPGEMCHPRTSPSGSGRAGRAIVSLPLEKTTMKKSAVETSPLSLAEEKTEGKTVLRLKKRPLVSLTDDQMGDAAGGHNTCEPTCPPTCCPTCPNTCRGCPEPTDGITCRTCPSDCMSEAGGDAGCTTC